MPTVPQDETPQRTTDHIIADLSVNFVERLVLEARHSPSRVTPDYGYDLTVVTHRKGGYAESGTIYMQLKASRRLRKAKGKQAYSFSIPRAHYTQWCDEPMPVYLIRYCRHRDAAYWLYMQPYFSSHPKLFKKQSQQSATVHIPSKNVLTVDTIKQMRRKKKEIVNAALKAIVHKD